MRLWKRNNQAQVWFVEVEPRTWMRQEAQSADAARAIAMTLVPHGRGPWTVESAAEHGDKWAA